MAREALGLVETRGFTGAVEAADAMCKTARVRLVRYEAIQGALVTVVIRGPVADVEAAVTTGVAAAARVGEVFASHVIPAPDVQIEQPLAGPSGRRPRSSGA